MPTVTRYTRVERTTTSSQYTRVELSARKFHREMVDVICVRAFFSVSTIIEKKNLRKESSIIFLFSPSLLLVDYCFVTLNIFCENDIHFKSSATKHYLLFHVELFCFLPFLFDFFSCTSSMEIESGWRPLFGIHWNFFCTSFRSTAIAYTNNYAYSDFIYCAVAVWSGRLWWVHVPSFIYFDQIFEPL